MRVLVTGATGFVGSHAVCELLRRGHQVSLLVRDTEKAEKLFAERGVSVDQLVQGSVSSTADVSKALQGCDAVIHAAAITPMQGASEQELLATNVDGVKQVVGGALEAGINNIIFVSSLTAIFKPYPARVDENSPIAESAHPYGKSKAAAEAYVRSLQAQGKGVKTVYPGGIVGPDDPGLSATLMSLQYRMTQGFKVTSRGTQQIDVRDLAAIMVALLEKSDAEPGRYITTGHYMSWADFAALLEKVSGAVLEKKKIPGWFLRTVGVFYDIKRKFAPVALPISAETMRYATQWPDAPQSPALNQLAVSLRPVEDTFLDTLCWMLQRGLLQPGQVPALQNPQTPAAANQA